MEKTRNCTLSYSWNVFLKKILESRFWWPKTLPWNLNFTKTMPWVKLTSFEDLFSALFFFHFHKKLIRFSKIFFAWKTKYLFFLNNICPFLACLNELFHSHLKYLMYQNCRYYFFCITAQKTRQNEIRLIQGKASY